MNKFIILIILIGITSMTFAQENINPFFEEWKTPFGTPPFDEIKNEHYLPAFKKGIEGQNKEINAIVVNRAVPTFQTVVEPLEYSGELLTKVKRIFSAMNSSMTNEELQAISREVTPMLSKHNDDIYLNELLFKKIKYVFDNRSEAGLTTEQNMLLDKYYKAFIRGGANLSDEDKEELRKLNEELSMLSLNFGENVLKETNSFELVIDYEDDLAGLPESTVQTAAEEAESRGYEDKWIFTIHKPSMIPLLQYAKNRNLREKIYRAYFMKGDNGNDFDNKKIISRMAALRVKRAQLLDYPTHAHFQLAEKMAKNPESVYELLRKLWEPALNVAKSERDEMQKMIYEEGNDFNLASWDWWYYAEKIKKAKYDFDEDEVRPYFSVNNVINGVFGLATDLWGIRFEERIDIPKYHPDVKTFEVKDSDGSHIGILYTDYFPRNSKRGGAWMDAFRKQSKRDGEFIHPIIYNVGNFSKPTADTPSLLSLDEVETLFHEFGHALHGLLSECTYETVSGTATPRDFVEFPSQVMENWCMHPEVLKKYAKHYRTGEPIPDGLIEKINNSSKFNQGFATVEYLAASFLDMDWHTITEPVQYDVTDFENNSMSKIGLIEEIIPRYRSTYFNHIFSGGYSAGYYSYIWSEVLDADAFKAFEESGDVYNQELASKYRKYILASGGTDDAMSLYKKFRGKEPDIESLLIRRGLK
ncbi:MAG: M3 family metallopeptidase [Melioribacteraceae bacterium]|nr:M3 family metallopeptidase [Melioribacteraceae bacterium]